MRTENNKRLWRTENNKIVEKGKRKKLRREIKLTRERGRENIVRSVKKKEWFAFLDYFNRFFSNRCVFDSFCFKRYLVSDFIASNY